MGFLCVALATITLILIKTWRDHRRSFNRTRPLSYGAQEFPDPSLATRMEKAQLEADEFARQGNFAEAMHVLLLRSVEELRRYLNISIAASLTSREILRHAELSPEGRSTFSDIVDRVEVSYFGAHRPDQEEYEACRGSFDALRGALRRHAITYGSAP
jgi:hypothetical protein